MSANSVVIHNGIPVWVDDESIVALEEKVQFSIESGSGYPGSGGSYNGRGKLYLTSFRLIFLKAKPTAVFNSFTLPFLLIDKFKFKKPLIGTSYITGTVKPVHHGSLHGVGRFELRFNDNSTMGFFHKNVNELIEAAKMDPSDGHRAVTQCPSLVVSQVFPDQFRGGQRIPAPGASPRQLSPATSPRSRQSRQASSPEISYSIRSSPRSQASPRRNDAPPTSLAGGPTGLDANLRTVAPEDPPTYVSRGALRGAGRVQVSDRGLTPIMPLEYYQDRGLPIPASDAVPISSPHAAAPAVGYNPVPATRDGDAFVDPANPNEVLVEVSDDDSEDGGVIRAGRRPDPGQYQPEEKAPPIAFANVAPMQPQPMQRAVTDVTAVPRRMDYGTSASLAHDDEDVVYSKFGQLHVRGDQIELGQMDKSKKSDEYHE